MAAYDVTAEFYDVLQAPRYLRTAERLLDHWLAEPRIGVLDVGAGTGLATRLLARRTQVVVHAVEPSAQMRAVLLSRLAGHADLSSRVRVHAVPVQRLDLCGAADFALCLNTMGMFAVADRRAAMSSLARALVPGGTLVVQRPPESIRFGVKELPTWGLGGDTYGGEVATAAAGEGIVEWRFVYRVSRGGAVVREETETFTGYLVTAAAFGAELEAAGFTLIGEDRPHIAVARRYG